MALVRLIADYELRLEGELSSYKWSWETFLMPYRSSKVLMRKRQPSQENSAGGQ